MRSLPTVNDVLPQLRGATISHAEIVTLVDRSLALLHAHTRGGGFTADGTELDAELAHIVVASVARVVLNPERALASAQAPFTASPGSFGEWTIEELRILASYERQISHPTEATRH